MIRGDHSVISFSVVSLSKMLYQPCSSWGGSPMNGSPGFQNWPGCVGRLSPAHAHGMIPAIGVVGISDVDQRVHLLEVLIAQRHRRRGIEAAAVAREAELLEQDRLADLGRRDGVLVDVLLRALERLRVAPRQVLLVDPVPVGGPHVEADEVDRRALVIVDDVEPGVDRASAVCPSLPVVTSCAGASDLIRRAVASIHLRYAPMLFMPRGSLASSQMIIGLPDSFGTRKLMKASYAATAFWFV